MVFIILVALINTATGNIDHIRINRRYITGPEILFCLYILFVPLGK